MICVLQKYVIVFEEEVMARRHYLGFIAQCLSAVEADESLIGISGWNENGKSFSQPLSIYFVVVL